MDFIKRVLEFFADCVRHEDGDMISFVHNMDDDNSSRVVTVHADPNGFLIFTVFTPEEWGMIKDVSELTGSYVEDLVKDISEESGVVQITVDPKELE
jgi:hypothetical protein